MAVPSYLLRIPTFSLEMAQAIHPAAGPGDVGDLKLAWDSSKPEERAAAKAAFEAASAMDIRFFRLEGLEGRLISSWDEVESDQDGEALAPSQAEPAPEQPRRRGGRRRGQTEAGVPVRVEGVAAVRGG